MRILITLATLALVATTVISCESTDAKKIFEAQACLDAVDETLTGTDLISAANACENKLDGLDTANANIIKCSTRFLAGGVTSSRISSAFENNSSSGSANQSNLISILAFTNYSTSEAKTKSAEALAACEKSEQKGLIFISGLSNIGTLVLLATSNAACMNLGNCTTSNLTNSNALASCTGTGSSNNCNPEEVGATAVILSNSYCTADKASDPVCIDIQAAVDAGGSNADIGAALLANMQ